MWNQREGESLLVASRRMSLKLEQLEQRLLLAAPIIGSVQDTPDPVHEGDPLTLTALNVVDSVDGDAITSVTFYSSVNAVFGDGDDVLLGAGSRIGFSDDWDWSGTASWAPGTYNYFAQAEDSNSELSTAKLTSGLVNDLPVVGTLSSIPDAVAPGSTLTLSATDVTDTYGGVVYVDFYHDANNNGTLDFGTDTFLGRDTDSSDGWSWTGAVSWSIGSCFAVPHDLHGADGDPVWGAVNQKPTIEVLTNSPNPIDQYYSVTFTAVNVSDTYDPAPVGDPDYPGDVGEVVQVEFWRDTEGGDGAFNPAVDVFLGYGTQAGSDWTLTVPAMWNPDNVAVYFTRAIDDEGAVGNTTFTLNQDPRIDDLAASLDPAVLEELLTLQAHGVTDADGYIVAVEFWGELDPWGDQSPLYEISYDFSEANDWLWDVAPAWSINEIVEADFNQDGYMDVAVAVDTTMGIGPDFVSVLLNDTRGGFIANSRVPLVRTFYNNLPMDLTAGDFDNDGYPDIAAVSSDDLIIDPDAPARDWVFVMMNTQNPGELFNTDNLERYTPSDLSFYPDSITSNDFNEDGVIDIAVATSVWSEVAILYGDGTGAFTHDHTVTYANSALPPQTALVPQDIVSADFDTDGHIDIATVGQGGPLFYWNNGRGRFDDCGMTMGKALETGITGPTMQIVGYRDIARGTGYNLPYVGPSDLDFYRLTVEEGAEIRVQLGVIEPFTTTTSPHIYIYDENGVLWEEGVTLLEYTPLFTGNYYVAITGVSLLATPPYCAVCGDWGGVNLGGSTAFTYRVTFSVNVAGSYHNEVEDVVFYDYFEAPPRHLDAGNNSIAGDVLFYDENTSTFWESTEDIWWENPAFNPGYDRDPWINDGGDGWETWNALVGFNVAGVGGVRYNDNGPTANWWDPGEDVWVDLNGDGSYDAGETQLTAGGLDWETGAGTPGIILNVFFNDLDLNNQWTSGEDVWADDQTLPGGGGQYDDEAIYAGTDATWDAARGTVGIVGDLDYRDVPLSSPGWTRWVDPITLEPYGGEFIWKDGPAGTANVFDAFGGVDAHVYNDAIWHPVSSDYGIHGNLVLNDTNGDGMWTHADTNMNGRWDPGEPAESVWADAVVGDGIYTPLVDRDVFDIANWDLFGGEVGTQGALISQVLFRDLDLDGLWDGNEDIWSDVGIWPGVYDSDDVQIYDTGSWNTTPDDPASMGITGNIFFNDVDGDGAWDEGEDLWADGLVGDMMFDPILDNAFFDPGGVLVGGETGILGNVFFYDAEDDGLWLDMPGENCWADTFRIPSPPMPIGFGDSMVAVDFLEDGAGDIDIATANSITGDVSILLAGYFNPPGCKLCGRQPDYFIGMYPYQTNTTFGWVGGGQVVYVGNTPTSISAGDVNLHDTTLIDAFGEWVPGPDLITTNMANGTLTVIVDIDLLTPGFVDYSITDYMLSGAPYNRPFEIPAGLIIDDLDLDGVTDLVVADRYDIASFAEPYAFHNSNPWDLDPFDCEIPYLGETFGFRSRYSVIPWDVAEGDDYLRRTYYAQAFDDDFDPVFKPEYGGASEIVTVEVPFNQRPYIWEVASDREELIGGDEVTLTALGVGDVDGFVSRVEFYRDDGDGMFEEGASGIAGAFLFFDLDADVAWDPGEDVWWEDLGTGVYNIGLDVQIFDIGNWDPVQGDPGIPGNVYFDDADLSTDWTAGEDLWADGANGGFANGQLDWEYQVSADANMVGGAIPWTVVPTTVGIQGDLYFADADVNGRFTWDEDIWVDLGGVLGTYEVAFDVQVFLGVDGVWTTADATPGIQGNIYFEDVGATPGLYDAGEQIWADALVGTMTQYDAINETIYDGGDGWDVNDGQVGGIQGNVLFYDADSSTDWTAGEDLWVDVPSVLGQYDVATDTIVYDGGVQEVIDGDPGDTDSFFYTDTSADGQWQPGENTWWDATGNGTYESLVDVKLAGAGDTLLGVDSNGSNGWSWTGPLNATTDLFWVRAIDAEDTAGKPVGTYVNELPAVNSLYTDGQYDAANDTVIQGAPAGVGFRTDQQGGLLMRDANLNGRWDLDPVGDSSNVGEDIWEEGTGGGLVNGIYDWEYEVSADLNMVVPMFPFLAAPGTPGIHGDLYFADTDGNGRFNWYEEIWADVGGTAGTYDAGIDTRVFLGVDGAWNTPDAAIGVQGNLYFNDATGAMPGLYEPGLEEIWADASIGVTGSYDLVQEDQVYAGPIWATEESSAGILGNVLFSDTVVPNNQFDPGEAIWAEEVYQDEPLVLIAVDVSPGSNSNAPIRINPNLPDDPDPLTLPDIVTGKVHFYRDSNYNGVFDPDVDYWLGRGQPVGDIAGYGTGLGEEWAFTFLPSVNWTPGTQTIFVVAQDEHDEWSAVQASAIYVKNLAPEVDGLVDSPDPVTEGTALTLTATGVSDRYGWVDQVVFYRDDGDSVFEPGTDDVELGVDSDGGDGWNWTGLVTWGAGAHMYWARALDNSAEWSTEVSTTGVVNSRPVFGGLVYPSADYTVNDGFNGVGPLGIVKADFNDDGKLDIATANVADGTVSVLFGNGDGTLQAPTVIPLGGSPWQLVTGDFDENGSADLVVTDSAANQIIILLNDGAGNLVSTFTRAVGAMPTGIVKGDWNADGHLDVAVSNMVDGDVSILHGDGTGDLIWQRDIAVGLGPTELVTADFNRDGNADLASIDTTSDQISILLGQGTGQFLAGAPVLFLPGSGLQDMVVGQFDADSYIDIAVTAPVLGDVVMLWGNGDGTFVPGPLGIGMPAVGIDAAHMDSDNRLDLVVSDAGGNLVYTIVNEGLQTFTVHSGEVTGLSPLYVLAADMNSDGANDIVSSNNVGNSVTVATGIGGLIDEYLFDPFVVPDPTLDYDPAGQGQLLILQGTGLRDPDFDAIVDVQFWRDTNGSGVFESASDQQLDPDSVTFLGTYQGGEVWQWAGTVTWDIGDHLYFVRALDDRGGWSYAVAEPGRVINPPPVISGGLFDQPDPVTEGYDLTLIAQNVVDANGTINVVEFYLDANASGNLEIAEDTLLGFSSTGVGGEYSITVPVTWAPGMRLYFARAQDDMGEWSETVEAEGLVNGRPVVTSLLAYPNPLRVGGTLTLEATGVFDPDAGGSITQVEFYRDTNNNEVFDLGFDQFIATDLVGADGWMISFAATSSAHRFFARAQDNLGGWSFAAMSPVVNRLPLVGGLSDSPDPVTQGDDLRLDASDVQDVDGTVDAVEFYRDANGNDLFDDGIDVFLGIDTTAGDGWYWVGEVTWSGGMHTYMARARDDLGNWTAVEDIPTTDGYVNRRPGLTGLIDNPDPVTRGYALTLTALGVDDPDGTVQEVEFYRAALPLDYNSAEDTPIVGTPVDGDLGFRFGLMFADLDANGLWDAGEEVWQEGTGGGLANDVYDWEYQVDDGGDGWGTAAGTIGIHGDLLFNDTNLDGQFNWDEEIWKDVDSSGDYTDGVDVQVFAGSDAVWDTLDTTAGIQGNLYFDDTGDGVGGPADGLWQYGEEIWADSAVGVGAAYDNIQEVRVYDGGDGWSTEEDAAGLFGNILYYDADADGEWTAGEAAWADNPVLDIGSDVLLGSDTSAVGGWEITASTAGWPLGQFAYFARARDNSNAWGDAVWTTGRVNGRPVVGGLQDLPDPVTEGEELTLTALAVVDIDQVGSVELVEFWVDFDFNGTWDPNADWFLGYDTDGADAAGWSWTGTVIWPGGMNHTYFTRARDNDDAWSAIKSVTGYVNLRPTIANLTPVPNPVNRGDLLTLTAWTVGDIDGSVAGVQFFRSTTALGYDDGFDTVLLGTPVDGDAGITGQLVFADDNHNGMWDLGEDMWNDGTGGGAINGLYDYEWVWDGGDALLQVVDGVTAGVPGDLFWVDTDGNGLYNPYEEIWADDAVLGTLGMYDEGIDVQVYAGEDGTWDTPDGLRGVPQVFSNLAFDDTLTPNGVWDPGEDIWADALGAGVLGTYNAIEETQLYDGGDGWQVLDGTVGMHGDVYFHDTGDGMAGPPDGLWQLGEDLFADVGGFAAQYDAGTDVLIDDGGDGWQILDGDAGVQGNVHFYDADSSGDWTDGEGLWADDPVLGTPGVYDDGIDTLILDGRDNWTAINGAPGFNGNLLFRDDVFVNGIVDPGEPVWVEDLTALGTGTQSGVDWVRSDDTSAWPAGDLYFVSYATDAMGALSQLFYVTGTVLNVAPTIMSLSDSPDPLERGQGLTLTANNVGDNDGYVTQVEFWLDADASGTVTPGDVLLDTDVDGGDGWEIVYSNTIILPLGLNQYLAQAQDNDLAWSVPALTTGTVLNGRPTIGSVEVDPDPIVVGLPLDVTALNVVDPDGPGVSVVEFYVGRYDFGVDAQIYDAGNWDPLDGDRGTRGNVYFRDTNGNDLWDGGEPLWAELGGVGGVYNAGTDTVINPATPPLDGDGGIQTNVFFYDADGDDLWTAGEDLWAEAPSFADAVSGDGWSWDGVSTVGWQTGEYTFLARAFDTIDWGDFVSYSTQANQRPVITQFLDSPDPLPRADTLTLTVPAGQVSDPDGDDIVAVEFYMDVNGDGLFDAGTYDLGLDTQVYDAGAWDPADGQDGIQGNVYFRDTNGNTVWDAAEPLWAELGGTAGVYDNGIDTVINLATPPTDGDAGTQGNLYFWDADLDGLWTATEDVWADDLLLGIDTSAAGDWEIDYTDTIAWAIGTHTYFARAQDDRGTYSLPFTATGEVVNNLPVVGTFICVPDQIAPGDPITLTASNVVDYDGTVQEVEFWWDANGNGVFDGGTYTAGEDTVIVGAPLGGDPGIQGDVYFFDIDADGVWDFGEDLWADIVPNGVYDFGVDSYIYDGGDGADIFGGEAGIQGNVYFDDADGDLAWTPVEALWAEEGDLRLGNDLVPGGGGEYELLIPDTSTFPLGNQTYFARALDNDGAWGPAAAATGLIEYQRIACGVVNGAVIVFYDTDVTNGISAPNIAWGNTQRTPTTDILINTNSAVPGQVAGIYLYGDGTRTQDIGCVVYGYRGLNRFVDSRRPVVNAPFGFLAVQGNINSARFNNGLTGASIDDYVFDSLCSPLTWHVRGGQDVDGNAPGMPDLTGVYADGNIGTVYIRGQSGGDIVAETALRTVNALNGLNADVTAWSGGITTVMSRGDVGHVHAFGDIRSVRVTGGDILTGVTASGSPWASDIGTVSVSRLRNAATGLYVGGAIAGQISATGNVTSIRANGGGLNAVIDVGGNLNTLSSMYGDMTVTLDVGGRAGAITCLGGDLAGTINVNDRLTSVRVTASRGVGGDFSGDVNVAGNMNLVSVMGNVTDSDFDVGGSLLTLSVVGNLENTNVVANKLSSLRVRGLIRDTDLVDDYEIHSALGPFSAMDAAHLTRRFYAGDQDWWNNVHLHVDP